MLSDTICAIATASGGALGIVRLSGPKSFEISDGIFRPTNGVPISQVPQNTIHYGHVYDCEGNEIDDVMVSKFKAPHSFTGEDSIEISCHGSKYILAKIIEELIRRGCRQASPGEFTKRAFLNGKMDLSQAEAVADIISAESKATHDVALSQMRGEFSSALSKLREKLLHVTSLLELELDFSEEDVEFADRKELISLVDEIKRRIESLIKSYDTGKALKEGVPVAIIGKTNVGKSTILNRFLHDDKAIVSDIHGTTRDTIEDVSNIHGVDFRFIDTAGLRQTDDKVETIGIERTYKTISNARIVLWVVDEEPTPQEYAEITTLSKDKTLLLVQNKSDLKPLPITSSLPMMNISAQYDATIEPLEDFIFDHANLQTYNDVIITNSRHYEALLRALDSIARVMEGLTIQNPGDIIAEDLRDTLHILAEITGGEIQSSEVLNSIFSSFCIGK